MKKSTLPTWSVPLALLLLCLLSFGTMASRLGFFWDDWSLAYYIHFLGPESFPAAYAEDRPLIAPLYMLTTSLIGESPVAWQAFALLARWATCLAAWWLLHSLWPDKLPQTVSIAFLFAVYPGFQQQHIAITYGNFFLMYAAYILSMVFIVQALRNPRWFWPLYLLSLPAGGYTLFILDYFFGLELLRPVLMALALREKIPDLRLRLRKVILYWIPFIILNLLFLVWRLSNASPRGTVTIFETLSADPWSGLGSLAGELLGDLLRVTVLAWGQVVNFSRLTSIELASVRNYLLISLGAGLLVILFLSGLRPRPADPPTPIRSSRRWGLDLILLGVFALLLAGIPFWATDLRIMLSFTRDRFTLGMMLGAALLLFGLIQMITWRGWQAIILVGLAVGAAAGFHYLTSLAFYKEWQAQKDFFWQLAWRVPGLQQGTAILTTEMPFPFDSDNSLTSPLNWIYAPDLNSLQLPYVYYDVESHRSRGLPELSPGMPINVKFRLIQFQGSLSQALLVIYRPPACLKVIEPEVDRYLPEKPRFFNEALTYSRPELILTDAANDAQPPARIFGPEPEHGWCYTFEKADLARQEGDWQEIARLGDQALGSGKKFYRRNAVELLPFILGYAHTGQWEKASQLSQEAYQAWENMRLMLCEAWDDLSKSGAVDNQGQPFYQNIWQTLNCEAR